MNKGRVTSKAKFVGPKLVEVVGNLIGRNPLYLDITGSTHKVLGVLGASYLLIVRKAATTTGDGNRYIEMLANDLQNGEQLSIHRVHPAPVLTGEFGTAEVG